MKAEKSIESEAETSKLTAMHVREQQENNDNVEQKIEDLQEEFKEKQ